MRMTKNGMSIAVVVLCMSLTPHVATAGLTSTEHCIAAAVQRGEPAAQQLLARTVDINSGTMNLEGVRAVGKIFAAEFDALGFTTRWVDGAAWQRAGHLIATHHAAKRGATRVLLIGHLDTVFEADSPFQHATRLTDSTVAGPGIGDMKGGDVIALLALRALRDAGVLDRLEVTAIFPGDEEKPGDPMDLARADIRAAAAQADIALGFENGDGLPNHAVIARRGSSNWILAVHGTPAHSAQIFRPDLGHGAIFEAARLLAAFEDSLAHDAPLTFNPGTIVGGTTVTYDPATSRGTAFGKTNVIAESTIVHGDLRPLTPEQLARARAVMSNLAAHASNGTRASVTFDDGYPPFPPRAGNYALLHLYAGASRDLGYGDVTATDPARCGAADISFTDGLTLAGLDGLGLNGDKGHTVDEWANTRSLARQAQRVAVLLARLVEPKTVETVKKR